jgi:hypothetical protein
MMLRRPREAETNSTGQQLAPNNGMQTTGLPPSASLRATAPRLMPAVGLHLVRSKIY